MATDTEQLVVLLEAKINDFEKNFQKANKTASDNWTKIEARGKQAATRLESDMAKAAAGVGKSLAGIGAGIASSFGIGGLGLSAFLAIAVKINGELAKMEGMAKRAGITTDRLQEDKFAANIKGVSDEDFNASISTSLGLLDEAQRNVNTLSWLFNANNISIRNSNGALLNFDQLLERAATLMAHARSEQEKIKIAEMLGLSRDWVRVLQDGPAEFRRLADGASGAGAVIDKETIAKAKEFDRAWTEAIVRFKAGMTEALTDLGTAFGNFWRDLIDQAPGSSFIADTLQQLAGGISRLTIPELEGAIQRSIEQGIDKVEIERLQAELNRRLGNTPLKVTVKPELVDDGRGPTVIPKDKQKNPFDSALFDANKRIAALDAETKTIGMNSEARERAKLVAQLEEAAKKANTEAGFQNATVTDAQRQKINQLADAMEAAAKRQRVAQSQFEAFNETLKFGGGLAVEFFDALGDKTKKFSDLFASAMASVKKAALNALILGEGPLAGLFGTKSTVAGGTGGLLGMLFAPAVGKADGGLIRGPGTSRSDSIPARLSNGEFVVQAAATARHLPLLKAINAGTVPRFADGGLIGSSLARVSPRDTAGPLVHQAITVNVAGSPGTPAQNQDLADRVVKGMKEHAQSMVAQEIRRHMRPGGMINR